MIWLLARLMTGTPLRAVLLVLVALGGYLLMVPSQVPVVRAGVMAAIFCIGYMTGRRTRAIDLLMLAAIVLLLWRPADLFTAGFQLSFVIVAALLLFVERWATWMWMPVADRWDPSTWRWRLGRWAVNYAAVTLVAFVTAMPLVAYHFHRVYPWSMVLSVVTLPLFVVVLGLGYVKVMLGLIWPGLGVWLAWPTAWAGRGLLGVIHWGQDWPQASMSIGGALSWVWLVGCAAVAWAFLSGRFNRRKLALLTAVMVIGGWTWWSDHPGDAARLTGRPRPAMRVTMLAVGNGSCYLVRSGGHTLMFDCGSQSYLDVGTRTVAPALAALHVHRIDMLMLSHADIDHYCGTLDVADAVPVDRVLMTGQMLDEARQEPWAAIGHLLAGLKSRHLPIVQVQRGWRGTLGRAKLSLLWPPRDFLAKQDNDMCMVLSVRAGHRRLLLNGDIQQIAMQGLFAHRTHLRADVTDLPHHGSFVEDSPRWFARVDPLLVLQSTGPARLANDQWTRLLMGTDVQRYITARQGMVRLRVASDGRMWVKTFLGRSSGWRLVESAKPAARRQAVKSAAPAR